MKIKDPRQLKRIVKKMKKDISIEAIEKMRWELLQEKPYYGDVGDEIMYDDNTGTIFSGTWAPLMLNQGRMPGSWVPIDALVNWVQKYKEPGSDKRTAMSIAKKVNFKINREGVDPIWYVDNALFDMEQEHE